MPARPLKVEFLGALAAVRRDVEARGGFRLIPWRQVRCQFIDMAAQAMASCTEEPHDAGFPTQ